MALITENLNRIAQYIDINNPVYLLLKTLGCDLLAPITNKYDAFVLGLQFVFACGLLFFLLKYLFKLMSHFLGGSFAK